jgi:lipopolysaccharide export system protein LptC
MAMDVHLGEDMAAARRFNAAQRHSRRVRLLRRAIPIGAVLAVGAILFIAIVGPFRTLPANVSVGAITLNGTKVTMELPKLTGFKKDLRPYEVNAHWAAQDIKNPNVIELKELSARIALQDRSFATIEALNGVYDSSADKLDLKDDVRVRTDSGYDVRMDSAQIEFKGGKINAKGLDMVDNGQKIVFLGRVHTVLKLDAPPPKPRPAADAPQAVPPSPLAPQGADTSADHSAGSQAPAQGTKP